MSRPRPLASRSILTGSSPRAEGVLAVDNRLQGAQVKLRPSQDKFQGLPDEDGGESFCLNVSDAFTRPGPLRLSAFPTIPPSRPCRPLMRAKADHLVTSFARMTSPDHATPRATRSCYSTLLPAGCC